MRPLQFASRHCSTLTKRSLLAVAREALTKQALLPEEQTMLLRLAPRKTQLIGPAILISTFACSGSSPSGTTTTGGDASTGGVTSTAGGTAVNVGGNKTTSTESAAGGRVSAGGVASGGTSIQTETATGGQVAIGGTSASSASATGGFVASGTTSAAGGKTSAAGGATSGGTTNATGGATSGTCGAGDTNLPAEPKIPTACATVLATQNVASGAVPSETALDTNAIQSALNACPSGQAVKLAASGTNNALATGPITIPAGITLWVDAGTTLYATRNTTVWGSSAALISVSGANSGIVGDGVIDGQGGEPNIGSTQSWWDQNAGSSGNSPALIAVRGATNFTMYRITLHDSPKFHVKLGAAGFVVWGVTVKAPSKAQNSAGTALTYSNAHNTDGIDPGEAASNGYIVCSKISTGDDHVAIKGSSTTGVTNLVIAHNRFGAGHGMSIGSEFTGGVSGINVYDLSIDGQNMGTSGGSSNGIRIKSDSSRGGLVNNVTYSDICVRNVSNPIFLTPFYSTATGSAIPQYTNILIKDFHWIAGGTNTPKITLDGYDASHLNSVTLDNVVIDGITAANVVDSYTTITLGPGAVNFTPPTGNGATVTNKVTGSSTTNPCANKWTTF